MTASIMISDEPNQSCVSPRSSINLKSGNAHRENAEAEPVELHPRRRVRLRQKRRHPRRRQNAERQVDKENPPPIIQFGQIAAERGPRIGPTITPMPQIAIAEPRFSGG